MKDFMILAIYSAKAIGDIGMGSSVFGQGFVASKSCLLCLTIH